MTGTWSVTASPCRNRTLSRSFPLSRRASRRKNLKGTFEVVNGELVLDAGDAMPFTQKRAHGHAIFARPWVGPLGALFS